MGAPTTGDVLIPSTTNATSTTTGALVVAGGLGVGLDIYARNLKITGLSGPYGYSAAGGSGVQTTSITTTVAVSYTCCGQITTVSSTLAAGLETTFAVTAGLVEVNDFVHVWLKSYAGAGNPMVFVSGVAAGSFNVTITNLHASAALNAAMVIGFMIIKGVITA
jgi:hypothetical protein